MQEDLAGELSCRFCALLDRFDPARGTPLGPYIVRQLSLTAQTCARRRGRIPRPEATWMAEAASAEQTAPLDPSLHRSVGPVQNPAPGFLLAAMENLPPRQRSIVISRYYEDLSLEEIADLMAIQPNTARSLLQHGLNNLRKAGGATGCC